MILVGCPIEETLFVVSKKKKKNKAQTSKDVCPDSKWEQPS